MNSFRSLAIVPSPAERTARADAIPPRTAEPPRLAFLGALASGLLSAEGAQRYEAPSQEALGAPFGARYAARLGGLLTPSTEAAADTALGRAR